MTASKEVMALFKLGYDQGAQDALLSYADALESESTIDGQKLDPALMKLLVADIRGAAKRIPMLTQQVYDEVVATVAGATNVAQINTGAKNTH